jgi:cytochrome c oxidase assembly protein subunit 15
MDHVIVELGETAKDQWVNALDWVYIVHRTFSWLVLVSHIMLWRKLSAEPFQNYRHGLLVLIGISFFTGILMAYFALPIGSQAVHLLISLLLIGWHIQTFVQTKTA